MFVVVELVPRGDHHPPSVMAMLIEDALLLALMTCAIAESTALDPRRVQQRVMVGELVQDEVEKKFRVRGPGSCAQTGRLRGAREARA